MDMDNNSREIVGRNRYWLICGLLEQLERHDFCFVQIMNRIIRVVNRGEYGEDFRHYVAGHLQEYRQHLLDIHVRIFDVAGVTEKIPRRVPQVQIPDSANRGEWVSQSLDRLDQLESYRHKLIRALKSTQGGNHEQVR